MARRRTETGGGPHGAGSLQGSLVGEGGGYQWHAGVDSVCPELDGSLGRAPPMLAAMALTTPCLPWESSGSVL